MQDMKNILPLWAHPWLEVITIGMQIALIILLAMLLRALLHRFIRRVGGEGKLPLDLIIGSSRLSSFLIAGGALLLILDRLGVSGTVIWTAFTGFATVASIAFFAAWSVLSNIFCSVLIYTTRPFRLHDHIEILENGDKPGLGGQVIDINLIYTTLQENTPSGPCLLQVPNSLFFQRMVRLKAGNIDASPQI